MSVSDIKSEPPDYHGGTLFMNNNISFIISKVARPDHGFIMLIYYYAASVIIMKDRGYPIILFFL